MIPAAPLPDAAAANWVDRHAPMSLRPWLKLGRFDRPAGIWLLLLPGWQGIALAAAIQGRRPDPWLLALFLAGAALMRAAGCAFNDIVDRDFDAQVARTAARPIPAGQISVKQAVVFVAVCCLASLLILLTLPPLAIALGAGSLLLVAAYPFMKRITWWPQAWLGLTFNWGVLLGFAAATGELAAPALLLYAAGVFWTLGYDTIYAIQDLEDDALAGVKSSALRLGAAAPRAVAGFYAISVLLAAAAAWTAGLSWLFAPPALLYAAHLGRQARRVRIDDPAGALVLFKSNTLAGLILFAAVVAGGAAPVIPPNLDARRAFILQNTRPERPPHTPEIQLHLATEITPIWKLTEEALAEIGVPPPFWAFAWAGGQALARYVLDNPKEVAGHRVIDFATGSGLVAVAAMKAGAADVLAADIDGFCEAAVGLNSALNGVAIAFTGDNLLDAPAPAWAQVILAGDICYEQPLAARVIAWLTAARDNGARVLIGDPGRSYFPRSGLVKLAEYQVATTRELEDMEVKKTCVWTLAD